MNSIPWKFMPFIFFPFFLAALVIGSIGIWELIERHLFLKRLSAETQGKVVSRIQATHEVYYQRGYGQAPETGAFRGTMSIGNAQSYRTDGGEFLWLEFEVIDYKTSEKFTYSVRTKRTYKISDNVVSLPIKYNPYNPEKDYLIDGFFSRSISGLKVLALGLAAAIETGLVLYARFIWDL
jgi:hypothetical protein